MYRTRYKDTLFFLAVRTMLRWKKILSRDRIRKRVQSDVMLCTDIVNRYMNNHIKKNVFVMTRSISNDRFVTLTSYIDAISKKPDRNILLLVSCNDNNKFIRDFELIRRTNFIGTFVTN